MKVLLLIVSLSIVGAWSASSSAVPAESEKFRVMSVDEFNKLKAYFSSDKNVTFLKDLRSVQKLITTPF